MNEDVQIMLDRLVGQECWYKEVSSDKSLCLGFGGKTFVQGIRKGKYRGDWEVGTYQRSWRVFSGETLIAGSESWIDSYPQLHQFIENLVLGNLVGIQQIGRIDVELIFDTGYRFEILALTTDDYYFHIFCPGSKFIKVTAEHGWRIGPSDEPWD